MKRGVANGLVIIVVAVGVWWLVSRFQLLSGSSWGALLALVVLLPYGIGPVLVRFSHRQPAHPQLEPKRTEELPREVTRFIVETANHVVADGFAQWPIFAFGSKGVTIYLKLFVNRPAQDVAMITVAYTSVGDIRRVGDKHVAFETKLQDGFEIRTSNSQTVGVLPPSPAKNSLQLMDETDPRRIYKIHAARVQRLAGGRGRVLPAEGQEIAAATEQITKDLQRQVEVGYFFLDESVAVYRPTWKGAVLMTWKLCWPVKQIRRARIARRANEALRELGLAV